jgi:hypothetical protein
MTTRELIKERLADIEAMSTTAKHYDLSTTWRGITFELLVGWQSMLELADTYRRLDTPLDIDYAEEIEERLLRALR